MLVDIRMIGGIQIMKKMFVCLLVLVMLISSTMVAHAEELFVSDTVMSKRMLAKEHEDEYVEYSSLEEKKMAIERQQNIFALLGEMQANLMDYETGDVELEALGVYKLETESTPDEVNSRSTQPSDVSLNTVSIYLDAETSEWIVTTGGRWITLGWVDDMPSPFLWTAQIGAVYNIGGYDAFGVKHTILRERTTRALIVVFCIIMMMKGECIRPKVQWPLMVGMEQSSNIRIREKL